MGSSSADHLRRAAAAAAVIALAGCGDNTVSPNGAPFTTGAPEVGAPDASTGAVTIDPKLKDPDGDTLTFNSNGTGIVVTHPNGTFTFTPSVALLNSAAATDRPGVESVRFTADDGHGHTIPITVEIPVAANASPQITNVSVGTPDVISSAVVGTVTAHAPNASPLVFSSSPTLTGAEVTFGEATPSANGDWVATFTYTPTPEARRAAAEGKGPTTDRLTVRVSNGNRDATSGPIDVPIAPTA